MATPVRGSIDIIDPERRGHQPRIEARHMATDHADRRLVQKCDQLACRINRIAGTDRPVGKSRRADRGRGDDRCFRIEFVEANQAHTAILQRHPPKPAVLLDRISAAATRRQEQSADQPCFDIICGKRTRHGCSPFLAAMCGSLRSGWLRLIHAEEGREQRSCGLGLRGRALINLLAR